MVTKRPWTNTASGSVTIFSIVLYRGWVHEYGTQGGFAIKVMTTMVTKRPCIQVAQINRDNVHSDQHVLLRY